MQMRWLLLKLKPEQAQEMAFIHGKRFLNAHEFGVDRKF